MSEFVTLVNLIVVTPATNTTSERTFSAFRRLKSYLRTTMTQERLNHLMLLHFHKDKTDKLDLVCVANDFFLHGKKKKHIWKLLTSSITDS